MITVYLILAFLLFILYRAVKFFSYWKERNVPQYDISTICYKTALDFFLGNPIYEGQRAMYNAFSDSRYYGAYEFFRPRLFIRDIELIKKITIKDFEHFVDHTTFIPLDGDPIMENSLFLLKGEKWRRVRGDVSPIFTNTKMKLLFKVVCDCSKQLLDHIETESTKSSDFEMRDLLGKLTNDTIISTVFGLECNSLKNPNNQFFDAIVKITNFSGFTKHLAFILLQVVPLFSKFIGVRLISQKLCNFYKCLVVDSIQLRKNNNIKHPDMINLLMEAQKTTNKLMKMTVLIFYIQKGEYLNNFPQTTHFTYDLITAIVINFLGAGYDSVVTLLSFMLHELALNTTAQAQLQKEIDEVYEECNGSPSYEVVMKMQYLDMCIYETLRKWPSAMFLERSCSKPYTIQPTMPHEKPIHLKLGDPISISIFGLHYDSAYYPNPDKFDPERFSSENRSKISPYVFLPFGIGPRFCIGNRYALVQVKICMFYFLQKYSVDVSKKTSIPLRMIRKYFQLHPQKWNLVENSKKVNGKF